MSIQTKSLRKKLPGLDIRRNGRQIEVRGHGLEYRLTGSRTTSTDEAAATIASRMPIATIRPPIT